MIEAKLRPTRICFNGHIGDCFINGRGYLGCRRCIKISRDRTKKKPTVEYKTWSSMRDRCLNPNNPMYKWYGERGIKICQRWDSYHNFLEDMGKRPEGLSLDRRDNDGDYTPENCRWASAKQQSMNRRGIKSVTIDGIEDSVNGHCKRLGLNQSTISGRINRGWSVISALKTKVGI